MMLVGATDWLGTDPLFYHEKTGRVSRDIHEVIDLRSLDFDGDALRDYLDFGYCVFGRTPIQHVRFLTPGKALYQRPDCGFAESTLADPSDSVENSTADEHDTLDRLCAAVREWEARQRDPIVLPLSGGLDSRLLASFLREPARARAFTYGISDRPERSAEVVVAREVAARLRVPWRQVPLERVHAHLDAWDRLMGPSAHAHGMYHFAFYTAVHAHTPAPSPLLSGIVGDAWAGSIALKPAAHPNDLLALGYTHGSDARGLATRLPHAGLWRAAYWEAHYARLANPRRQAIEVIRLKMMLLRYLLRLPEHLGYSPWSPFTDPDLALAMLRLAPSRRENRRWQRDYFARTGLDVDATRGDPQNSLDYRVVTEMPPPPLDVARLRELFKPDDIAAINALVCRPGAVPRALAWLHTRRRGPGLARRLGLPDRLARAYAMYTVIRPLDRLLARREAA
jgi:hypothetical protein